MSRKIIKRSVMLLVGVLSVLAVSSSAALASGPPIINATTPTQTSLNTALLGGTLNRNGSGTTYKVEYGRTKLYGQSTPTFTAEAEEVPLGIELFGLQQMSTYHYRVSATNSSGTTTTPDALFETLMSWKVEGTPVENLTSPAHYEDKYKGLGGEGGKIEIRGLASKIPVRFYCRQSAASTGILGVEYTNLVFNNGCFAQVNGVKNAACTPSGITMQLSGNLGLAAKTKIETSEACAAGESFTFSSGFGGYGLQATTAEKTEQALDLNGTLYRFGNNNVWETELTVNTTSTSGAWKLSGANAGKVFGVS
jgi:hypothetical protein